MAKGRDSKENLLDKLYDELVDALEGNSCLSSSYCQDAAGDVINALKDSTIEDILGGIGETETAEVLSFLETLRRRYYTVLEPVDQRELEKLLIEFRP